MIKATESLCPISLMGEADPWKEGKKKGREGEEEEKESQINFVFFYISAGLGLVPRKQKLRDGWEVFAFAFPGAVFFLHTFPAMLF